MQYNTQKLCISVQYYLLEILKEILTDQGMMFVK